MTQASPDGEETPRGSGALPPLPPMRLGRAAQAALIGLRVFLGVVTAMAVFTILRAKT